VPQINIKYTFAEWSSWPTSGSKIPIK